MALRCGGISFVKVFCIIADKRSESIISLSCAIIVLDICAEIFNQVPLTACFPSVTEAVPAETRQASAASVGLIGLRVHTSL